MIRILSVSLASIVVLSGCSSMQSRTTNNSSVDYSTHDERIEMRLADGLESPSFKSNYVIPEVNADGVTGKNISVVSPNLVMPLLKNTFIQEGSQDAVINIDRINDNVPLEQTVWRLVRYYLTANELKEAKFDESSQTLTTDWIVLTPQAFIEVAEDEDTTASEVSGKFSFTFNIKEHKRSGLISTRLIDIDGSDNGISKRNLEVNMLNDVLALEAKRLRKEQELRRDEMKKGIAVTLGFDGNGESAFIVDAEFDISWVRFLSALKTLGFTIDDRDSSAGTIYAKYNGGESSFFGSLIGSEDDLPIDKQTYHIQLGDLGKKTTIAFLDDENIPMSAKFMSDIHQAFADSMADDSLKIK